ncbi:MAG: hypothetical protein HY320_09220 [Armatimonadetes bacterium]|nr:hypothetical protein [Armatimonadota bacterium]
MLLVPCVRQPDHITCLPMCVWAVLRFGGFTVEFDEVLAACRVDRRGAVWQLTALSLQEAGWDVEVVRSLDLDAIRASLAEERPLIAILLRDPEDPEPFAHAVVVCDVEDAGLVVMDPSPGEYVRLPWSTANWNLADAFVSGLLIGGATTSAGPEKPTVTRYRNAQTP